MTRVPRLRARWHPRCLCLALCLEAVPGTVSANPTPNSVRLLHAPVRLLHAPVHAPPFVNSHVLRTRALAREDFARGLGLGWQWGVRVGVPEPGRGGVSR